MDTRLREPNVNPWCLGSVQISGPGRVPCINLEMYFAFQERDQD
jgi:hypothetical protein